MIRIPRFQSAISTSVGNDMASDPSDVIRTRRNFKTIGRYKGDTDRPYIDRSLDGTIRKFQHDMGLRQDGLMTPGGKTERTLNVALRLAQSEEEMPAVPPGDVESEELPPPNIPGTEPNDPTYRIDPEIEKKPPLVDPHMQTKPRFRLIIPRKRL